jgi:hypothetical protein
MERLGLAKTRNIVRTSLTSKACLELKGAKLCRRQFAS